MISHSSRHARQLFSSGKISSTDPTAALSTLSLSAYAVCLVIACIMAGEGNQTVNGTLATIMTERMDLPLLSIGDHLASVATLFYLFWTLFLSCHCHNA
jgi:hypothetical protein